MSPVCSIKYYILGIADNVHKHICHTKNKYAATECNTSHFKYIYIYIYTYIYTHIYIYIYIYIYMSPKLEIHTRGPPP